MDYSQGHCNFKHVIFILRCQLTTSFIHSATHSVASLTTGPQFLPKRVLHRVRSSVSPIYYQYPLFSFRSSSSCLVLLLRLPVLPILPSVLSSIMCFRQQIDQSSQSSLFSSFILIFLPSSTVFNVSSFFIKFRFQLISFILPQHPISKLPKCQSSSFQAHIFTFNYFEFVS